MSALISVNFGHSGRHFERAAGKHSNALRTILARRMTRKWITTTANFSNEMNALILAAGYGTRLQRDLENDKTGKYDDLKVLKKQREKRLNFWIRDYQKHCFQSAARRWYPAGWDSYHHSSGWKKLLFCRTISILVNLKNGKSKMTFKKVPQFF